MIIRELFAKIGLQTDSASFAEGGAAVELVKGALERLLDVAGEMVTKFKETVLGVAEAGDQIKELSQSSGVGAESLQRLANAAKTEGVGIDGLAQSLTMLTRMMASAKAGSAETAGAFKKAGVSIVDASGKLRGADAVFVDLAEAFSKLPDGAEKTALAFKVLGRNGPEMIKVLNLGREEIESLGKAGLVLTEEQIEAGDELIKTNRKLAAVTSGIWKTAIAPLLPAITDLVKQYTAWRKANAEIVKSSIKGFLSGLISVVRGVGRAFSLAGAVITFFRTNWIALATVLTATLTYLIATNYALASSFVAAQIAAIEAAGAAVGAWLAAVAPIAAAVAAAALFLLIMDDIRGFFEGEDSAIGRGIEKIFGYGTSTDVLETARNLWTEIGEAIHEAYDWLAAMVDKMAWILKWSPPALLYRATKGILKAEVGVLSYLKGKAGEAINGTAPPSGEYGPSEAPTGYGADLRERARLRGLRSDYALPEGDYGPTGPSTIIPYAQSGRSTTVTNNIQVTQLPGEDGEHFAQRVAAIADERHNTRNEEAAAGLPSTQ